MRHLDPVVPRCFASVALLTTVVAFALTPGAAAASCISHTPCLPPLAGCGYTSACSRVTFLPGFLYRNLAVHDFSACVELIPGQTTSGGFSCLVDFDLNEGPAWVSYSGIPASGSVTFTWTGTGVLGEDLYSAQLTQLDFSGSGLPQHLVFREMPAKDSDGQASVAVAGGDYQIESFFDVWMEASPDDGVDWLPGSPSCRLGLSASGPVPVHSSTWGAIKLLYR